jgi:hypothetical protein
MQILQDEYQRQLQLWWYAVLFPVMLNGIGTAMYCPEIMIAYKASEEKRAYNDLGYRYIPSIQ